jgi:hypothetical protein
MAEPRGFATLHRLSETAQGRSQRVYWVDDIGSTIAIRKAELWHALHLVRRANYDRDTLAIW